MSATVSYNINKKLIFYQLGMLSKLLVSIRQSPAEKLSNSEEELAPPALQVNVLMTALVVHVSLTIQQYLALIFKLKSTHQLIVINQSFFSTFMHPRIWAQNNETNKIS